MPLVPPNYYTYFFQDQGTSRLEPGRMPRENMTLSFYTWSEFEKNCGYSRLYGGVNFPDSVANVKEMSRQMGRRAVDFVRYHVNLQQSNNGQKNPIPDMGQDGPYLIYTRDRTRAQTKQPQEKEDKDSNFRYFLINP
jgi:hypothetical protein